MRVPKLIKDHLQRTASRNHWKKIKIRHHHGIAIPLFSLHSRKSCGIGEYLDLLKLIDWCKQTNLDVIQLLPLNEIHRDRSPYSAISSCALHPIYLSLADLDCVYQQKDLAQSLLQLQKLTSSKRINYRKVIQEKSKWLRQYFLFMKEKICLCSSFKQFIKENRFWLEPYSLFKVLLKEQKGKSWQKWPAELRDLSKKNYEHLLKEKKEERLYYLFLQYLCFSQMQKVKQYATKHGISLMGDLPILVNPHSFDVWYYRKYFDLSLTAGSPPDDFNKKGQKWNLPIYRWDVMRQDHFSWWKERLKVAERLYHLYRIDHVIGLLRIYAIAPDQAPVHGEFIPPSRPNWAKQGKEILKMMLSASSMLPIAEDLGFVPEETFCILNQLGICGTRIMRWLIDLPKKSYSALSMTTVSTHDLEPLCLWWQDYKEKAKYLCEKKGWKYRKQISSAQLKELLYDAHHTTSLFHVNFFNEYLYLFKELRWTYPKDERINIPGKILKTNWTYRLRPSIEEIAAHRSLNKKIEEIIK